MTQSIFNRAHEIMDEFKAKYPEDVIFQMAKALAEMEERYTADMRRPQV